MTKKEILEKLKKTNPYDDLINTLHRHKGYNTIDNNIQKLKNTFPIPTSIDTIFTIYKDSTINTTIIVNKTTKPTTNITFQFDQKPIPSFLNNPPLYHVSQTVKGYKNVPKSLNDLGKAIDRLDKQKILTQLAKRR